MRGQPFLAYTNKEVLGCNNGKKDAYNNKHDAGTKVSLVANLQNTLLWATN
jgi:hypothetical protein